jgi:L-aminopeptidase/D-esterase-like protein
MTKPGPLNLITDVPGLSIGNAHDAAIRTGTTVLVPDQRAVCAVDVRGGGPGTRETDALAAENLVDAVDAVVLSGGSSYGLAAADGVVAALGADGRGYGLINGAGIPLSPVVPGAILYDLANGGDKNWGRTPPYRDLGMAALAALGQSFELGKTGAGYGARAGAVEGGLGSASIVTREGYTIGAVVAVNSFGSVTIPGSDAFWAWPFEIGTEAGGVKPTQPIEFDPEDWGAAKANPGPRENTTIAVVATDAVLTPAQAKRVAIMAQDGFARAIRPVHAPFDGDVVFVLSTARVPLAEPSAFTLARLGSLAADVLSRAIMRGVHAARG